MLFSFILTSINPDLARMPHRYENVSQKGLEIQKQSHIMNMISDKPICYSVQLDLGLSFSGKMLSYS